MNKITKYLCTWLAVVTTLGLAGAALADVLELRPAETITVPTCSSTGGTSTTLTKGYYEIHVSGETANVCYAATCATGGMERVKGNHGATHLPVDTTVSCRSAGSGAVVQFVPGNVKR